MSCLGRTALLHVQVWRTAPRRLLLASTDRRVEIHDTSCGYGRGWVHWTPPHQLPEEAWVLGTRRGRKAPGVRADGCRRVRDTGSQALGRLPSGDAWDR